MHFLQLLRGENVKVQPADSKWFLKDIADVCKIKYNFFVV